MQKLIQWSEKKYYYPFGWIKLPVIIFEIVDYLVVNMWQEKLKFSVSLTQVHCTNLVS